MALSNGWASKSIHYSSPVTMNCDLIVTFETPGEQIEINNVLCAYTLPNSESIMVFLRYSLK